MLLLSLGLPLNARLSPWEFFTDTEMSFFQSANQIGSQCQAALSQADATIEKL